MENKKMIDSLKEFKFESAEKLSKIHGGKEAGEDTYSMRSNSNVADDCLEPVGPVIVVGGCD